MSSEIERVARDHRTGGHPHSGRCRWSDRSAGRRCAGCGSGAPCPIAELARRFELDRKTVRRCLRDDGVAAVSRPAPAETLLTTHARVSARAEPRRSSTRPRSCSRSCASRRLPGQLRHREALRPASAHAARRLAERTVTRFETPPGARARSTGAGHACRFRGAAARAARLRPDAGLLSRRGFYEPVPQRDAAPVPGRPRARVRALRRSHARAPLRPAAHGVPGHASGRIAWNPTFKASPSTGASSRGCASPTERRPRARSSRA